MAEGLREGGSAALMSFHPPKKAPQSGDWFHTDTWLSFNSIQHWPEDQIDVITRDWNLKPVKPTWIFEGRYEGYYKSNYKAADWGEWQCRQQAWQTVLAGAFGHTYGHERVFGFGKDGWDWKKELDAPGAEHDALGYFLPSLRPEVLVSRQPAQSLIDGEAGKAERLKSKRITASRTPDGRFAMFYSANGRPIRVKLAELAAGPLSGWWYNPRTGRWHAGGTETAEAKPFAQDIPSGPGAAVREFTPPDQPGDGHDWVLVLADAAWGVRAKRVER